MSSSNLMRCGVCRGKKEVMGAGMIFHTCKTCLGVGHVEAENNAEQDNIENTQNTAPETDVDTGAQDSGQTKRKQKRKSALGTGESHLPEREIGGKDSEESGCSESEEKPGGEQV